MNTRLDDIQKAPITIRITVKNKDVESVSESQTRKDAWHEVEPWVMMQCEQYRVQGFNVYWQATDTINRTHHGERTFCASCGYFCDGALGSSLFACTLCNRTFCLRDFSSILFMLCPEHDTPENRDVVSIEL